MTTLLSALIGDVKIENVHHKHVFSRFHKVSDIGYATGHESAHTQPKFPPVCISNGVGQ